MSADLKSKKRKSGDDVASSPKKAKTTSKSAEKSAPLKSALKKSKVASSVTASEKPVKTSAKGDDTKQKASKKVEKKSDKSSKKETAVESAVAVTEVEDDGSTTLTADQTAALLAGFSSDEEEEDEEPGLDIASLPAPPTADGEKKQRSKKAGPSGENDPETTPGTLYIGRLPHGFFERQMRAYFSQFGNIKNLRLARNKRTGKSQHHAFIEFNSASVADIVAKTMDKYLLFGHILQVRRIPDEQVNEKMWAGARGSKGGRVMPRNRIEGSRLRRGMEREGWEKRIENEETRRKQKSEKLKEMGYEFEAPAVKKVSTVPVKSKAIEAPENAGQETEVATETTTTVHEEPSTVETVTKTVEKSPRAVKTTVEKTVKRKSKTADASATKKSKKAKTS